MVNGINIFGKNGINSLVRNCGVKEMYEIVDTFLIINLEYVKQFIIYNIDRWLGLIGVLLICILYFKGK